MRRRVLRFSLKLVLLALLWVLDAVNDQLFQQAVALLALIFWPLTLAVAVLLNWLVYLADHDDLAESAPATMVEAADIMSTLAMAQTGFAIAAGAGLLRIAGVEIPGRPVLVFLAWGVVLIGIPALGWSGTLRRVWMPMLAERLKRR